MDYKHVQKNYSRSSLGYDQTSTKSNSNVKKTASKNESYSIKGDKWDQIGLRELLKGDYRTLYKGSSDYQNMHLVETTDIRLYLDQQLQFSSVDERIYHEALVHPAFALSRYHERVLILGGGDGLALREVLKYKYVKQVDLVDLDPLVLKAASKHPSMLALNEYSLHDKRVNVYCQDALEFLASRNTLYDIIIVDFPDPTDETISKLYTREVYSLLKQSLEDDGILVCQSHSPDDTPIVFWSNAKTMESAGLNTLSYHTIVPSFGDWGFHMASKMQLSWDRCKTYGTYRTLPSNLRNLSYFHPSVAAQQKYAIVNTMENLRLHQIYFKELRY
jgi:spermidine synthase